MKKIVYSVLVTLSGLLLLFGYRTSHVEAPAAALDSASTTGTDAAAAAGSGSASGAAGSGAAGAASGDATGASASGAASAATSTGLTDGTYTGTQTSADRPQPGLWAGTPAGLEEFGTGRCREAGRGPGGRAGRRGGLDCRAC